MKISGCSLNCCSDRRGPRRTRQGLLGSDAGTAHREGRAELRPRRPTSQSAPAALTDGRAARSQGRPARAPRWGGLPERARAGPAPPPGHPRRPPSASQSPHSAGKGTSGCPGTTADALSAVRTPLGLDGFPGAQRLVRRGKGRRAQAAFRPRVLPGPSPAAHPLGRRRSAADTRPHRLESAAGGGRGGYPSPRGGRLGCSPRSPTLPGALPSRSGWTQKRLGGDAAGHDAPGTNFTGLLPCMLH